LEGGIDKSMKKAKKAAPKKGTRKK